MRCALVALACALWACGAPALPSAPQPVLIAPPSGEAPLPMGDVRARVEPPSAPSDPDLPPAIVTPSDPACLLTGKPMTGGARARLAAGGPVAFEVARDVDAKLWLPQGSRLQGATLEASADGVTLRGVMNAEDAPLWATRGELLAGYVIPKANTTLRWLDGRKGHLTVQLEPRWNDVRYLVVPKGDVECAALSLAKGRFDPLAALDAGQRSHWGRLAKGEVRLLAAPAGDALAVITVGEGGQEGVAVHEQRDGHARVVYDSDDALLVGWVDASQVSQVPEQLLSARSWGTARGGGSGKPRVREVRCDHPVQLALRLRDQDAEPREASVGTVGPGVRIQKALDASGKLTSLWLPDAVWLHVGFGNVLRAKSSALADCRELSE